MSFCKVKEDILGGAKNGSHGSWPVISTAKDYSKPSYDTSIGTTFQEANWTKFALLCKLKLSAIIILHFHPLNEGIVIERLNPVCLGMGA